LGGQLRINVGEHAVFPVAISGAKTFAIAAAASHATSGFVDNNGEREKARLIGMDTKRALKHRLW
jgi:hypothetical protein